MASSAVSLMNLQLFVVDVIGRFPQHVICYLSEVTLTQEDGSFEILVFQQDSVFPDYDRNRAVAYWFYHWNCTFQIHHKNLTVLNDNFEPACHGTFFELCWAVILTDNDLLSLFRIANDICWTLNG